MIILEGPDGTGKSTLANYLGDRLNLPQHVVGGPPQTATSVWMWCMTSYSRAQTAGVMDRATMFSSAVYDRVFGRVTLRDHDFEAWRSAILQLPVVFIYCRTEKPNPTATDPGDTLAYQNAVKSNYEKIVGGYDSIFWRAAYTNRCMTYDFNNTEMEQCYEYILERLPRSFRLRTESQSAR